MPSDRPDTLRFGDFELDVAAYELRRGDRRIRLERRPMDLLLLFVKRRGELVTREDIVERLWGTDVFIDVETGINTVVRKVRQALRDSSSAPRFVETVQGKGYRFIAGVEVVSGRRQPSSGHEPRMPDTDDGSDQPAPADNGAPSGVAFGGTASPGDILPAAAADVATRTEPQPSSRGRRYGQHLGTGSWRACCW